MHALVNGAEGSLSTQGEMVVHTAVATGDAEPSIITFSAKDVAQLLRSRKDLCSAKVVISTGEAFIFTFDSSADRESFVESVVAIQSADGTNEEGKPPASNQPNEDWVASSICTAAVDVGILTAAELSDILRGCSQRGVAQPFDALESLVDRSTLRLKPITEQIENDILRQVPALAVILERHVTDAETKAAFWTAVVRRYFFFARTFLEEELRALDDAAGAPSHSSPQVVDQQLNAASHTAMPKQKMAPPGAQDYDEEGALAERLELAQTEGNDVPEASSCRLFCSTRPQPRLVRGSDACHCPTPSQPVQRGAVYRGLTIHGIPSEPTNRDILEALRLFWRSSDAAARSTALTKVSKKSKRENFLQRCCVERAQQLHK